MGRDINKGYFTSETQTKLSLFSRCFREWLPVFIYNKYVTQIHIYDFFAGSGKDAVGVLGSPLLLLDEARGQDRKYCDAARKEKKQVAFHFNELQQDKRDQLQNEIEKHIEKCLNNCSTSCIFDIPEVTQQAFKDAFYGRKFQNILLNPNVAKFILLDQYGFSQVETDIFRKLVDAPKTDFIFFISSSYVRRFKDSAEVKRYFDTDVIAFEEDKPEQCHRQIADYFESLIPAEKEYYLHNFTMQKGSNYYGLIFGTSHTFGMEKFLKVCWEEDPHSGESNCNLDNDWPEGTLFSQKGKSNKLDAAQAEFQKRILDKKTTTNIEGMKFALRKRCQPKLFIKVVKDMEKLGLITRYCEDGNKPRNKASEIHKAPKFRIRLTGETDENNKN